MNKIRDWLEKIVAYSVVLHFVLILIAPPLVIENAEWAYRRNFMLFCYPLVALAIGLSIIGTRKYKLDTKIRIPYAPLSAEMTIGGLIFLPVFLVIPTLNGYLDIIYLGNVPVYFAEVGGFLFPSISKISEIGSEVASVDQVIKAQAVHSYVFIAGASATILYAFRGWRHPELFFEFEDTEDKWQRSRLMKLKLITYPFNFLFLFFGLLLFFGWTDFACDEPGDFLYETKCAIHDDLLLFINAFALPLTLFGLISIVVQKTFVLCRRRRKSGEEGTAQ